MKYSCTLISVKDIEVSKKFYKDLFDQEVAMDLGANVTLSGGFVLQQDFAKLMDIDVSNVKEKSNNMELYFEADDFDIFVEKLKSYDMVNYVHPLKMYHWHQRVIRIYDPDYHIIEIGETMSVIARRFLDEGLSVEETAEKIQHPTAFVIACKEGLL